MGLMLKVCVLHETGPSCCESGLRHTDYQGWYCTACREALHLPTTLSFLPSWMITCIAHHNQQVKGIIEPCKTDTCGSSVCLHLLCPFPALAAFPPPFLSWAEVHDVDSPSILLWSSLSILCFHTGSFCCLSPGTVPMWWLCCPSPGPCQRTQLILQPFLTVLSTMNVLSVACCHCPHFDFCDSTWNTLLDTSISHTVHMRSCQVLLSGNLMCLLCTWPLRIEECIEQCHRLTDESQLGWKNGHWTRQIRRNW